MTNTKSHVIIAKRQTGCFQPKATHVTHARCLRDFYSTQSACVRCVCCAWLETAF